MMKTSQNINWHEGTRLEPHTFQQWNRHYEGTLRERLCQLSPFGWGVSHLAIDPDGLANGNVTLQEFRGVMPDGIPIRIPEYDAPPLSRSIGDLFPPSMEHLDLYLGIPREHIGVANCQMNGTPGHRLARYQAVSIQVPDYNTGENLKEIHVIEKNLRLLFSTEECSDIQTIKIGELLRDSNGTITLHTSYIPPCTWVSASPALMQIVRSILEWLMSMSTELADQQHGIHEHGGMDVMRFSLLRTIYTAIPQLNHIYHIGKVHPECLYRLLLELASELAIWRPNEHPNEFPNYDHDNLSNTFSELRHKIHNALQNIHLARYVTIPLEQKDERQWIARITDEALLTSGRFYLMIASDHAPDHIDQWGQTRMKLGDENEMDSIVKLALPGVHLAHLPQPPVVLPMKTGHHYFRLKTEGIFWNNVCRSHTLAIHLLDNLPHLTIALFVTKE